MFLWVRAVLLPPEALVVHEGQGNQERQQFQENPVEKHSGDCHWSAGKEQPLDKCPSVTVMLWKRFWSYSQLIL